MNLGSTKGTVLQSRLVYREDVKMSTLDEVKGLVENPPKEYRSAPFWGWNDRLQKENLGEQIEGFKKAWKG